MADPGDPLVESESSKKLTQQHRKQNIKTTILSTITAGFAIGSLLAAPLTSAQKEYLAGYEKIRVALVADDLSQAQQAAKALGEEGSAMAKSESLEAARTAFAALSAKAEKLASEQPGYYVVHCPMAKKEWVQTSEKIENPYYGKAMSSCGELKR